MDAQKDPKEMRFREAIDELERIVLSLESGELELEESVAAYEKGVALLAACRGRLKDAELRITTLMGEIGEDAPEVDGDEG